MMERMRRSFQPFAVGVLLTLAAVVVIQGLSGGTLTHLVSKLPAVDASNWLHAHAKAPDPGPWLKDHKEELTAIAALVAAAGLVIASLGLLVSASGQRNAAFVGSWNSSRDCLWHFNEQWAGLIESRKAADEALNKMPPYAENEQLTKVINFFDNMAFMGLRGHLKDELAWTNYYDEASDLWKRAAAYVEWQQISDNDPTLWCEFEPWIKRLAKIDATRRKAAMRAFRKRTALKRSAVGALADETAALEILSQALP